MERSAMIFRLWSLEAGRDLKWPLIHFHQVPVATTRTLHASKSLPPVSVSEPQLAKKPKTSSRYQAPVTMTPRPSPVRTCPRTRWEPILTTAQWERNKRSSQALATTRQALVKLQISNHLSRLELRHDVIWHLRRRNFSRRALGNMTRSLRIPSWRPLVGGLEPRIAQEWSCKDRLKFQALDNTLFHLGSPKVLRSACTPGLI